MESHSRKPDHGHKKVLSKEKHVKKKKNTLKQVQATQQESEALTVPRSIVYTRGKVSYSEEALKEGLMKTMMPYTARNIEISRKELGGQIINFANQMSVSHLIQLSGTEKHLTLKV